MNYRLTTAIALTTLSTLLGIAIADEDQTPKTPAARSALAKHANAQEAAKKAYEKALKEANDIATKELEAAKSAAMKAGNLDEANRIQAAIDGLKAEAPIKSGRVVILIKGEAEVYLNGRRLGVVASGQLGNFPLPKDASGELIVKARSDVSYRSMRIAIVGSDGKVIRGMTAKDVGAESREPDATFSKLWNTFPGDSSEWIYLPEKDKPATFTWKI